MNPTDSLSLLQEFFREKAALFYRHQAGAERVPAYDSNNAYQYVLAREDTHLDWLGSAIVEAGGVADDAATDVTLPGGGSADAARAVADDDARTAGEFLARWRPRVAAMTQARDRKLLELVLGESLEHQRFFAHARGRVYDLLGRRPGPRAPAMASCPFRWIE